jgi:tripartite-type tricarboxylate transporter receptor subunit TctC
MTRALARYALAISCATLAAGALAQEWAPTKAVRIIVPIVGGTNDIVARLVAPELQKALGQPVVVENKGGAGGNIGADFVAKSPPDGTTLLVGYNGPIAINATLFRNLPYDPLKDLAPITLAVMAPQFLVVHPSLPAKNFAEFIAYAKANPGRLSYASVSIGSASHLT